MSPAVHHSSQLRVPTHWPPPLSASPWCQTRIGNTLLCHQMASQTWSAASASTSSTTSSALPRCFTASTRSAWSASPGLTSRPQSPTPSCALCVAGWPPCQTRGSTNWRTTLPSCPTCPRPCRGCTACGSTAAGGGSRSKGPARSATRWTWGSPAPPPATPPGRAGSCSSLTNSTGAASSWSP